MSKISVPPVTTWQPPALDWAIPALIRQWRFIVTVAAVIITALFLALLIRGAMYETTAQVLIKLGRETVSSASLTDQRTVVQSKRPEDVTTEIQILLSPTLLGELVDEIGVEFFFAKPPPRTIAQRLKRLASNLADSARDARDAVLVAIGLRRELTRRERVVAVLSSAITAEVANRSDVIEVTMRSKDPAAGALILSKLLELYEKSHIKAFTNHRVEDFFLLETSNVQRQLKDAESARAELKAKTGLWSSPDQRKLLLEWQQQLMASQAEIQARIAAYEAEAADLRQQADRQPAELRLTEIEHRNEVLDKLRIRLADLSAKKAQLEVRYEGGSRDVQDVEREIATTRRAIASEVEFMTQSITVGPNEQRGKLLGLAMERRAQLGGLRAQAKKTTEQLHKVTEDLRDLETKDAVLRSLDREVFRLEHDWNQYARNLSEAKASAQMDLASIVNVTVISPPSSSTYPVAPSLKVAILGALFIGFGLPIALVLFQGLLWPVVTSRSNLSEVLGVPVLARIPDQRTGVS
jgi:uncharacterized protein involved in exopolysaccharide biosynthesis